MYTNTNANANTVDLTNSISFQYLLISVVGVIHGDEDSVIFVFFCAFYENLSTRLSISAYMVMVMLLLNSIPV